MDDKHKKAQEVYKQYQQEDPDEGVYEIVEDKVMLAADVGEQLHSVVENIGKRFASHAPKRAVSVLEAIYEVFQQKSEFIAQHANKLLMEGQHWDDVQKDLLFDHAVNVMYEKAEHTFQDTAKMLQDCYPDILGESSHAQHE